MIFSCVSNASAAKSPLYAYLTNSSKFFLLPPAEIGKSMDMAQQISASYAGQNYVFNAWVKADDDGMEMLLFNELGANMGELSYHQNSVNFSSPIFPKSLKSEYIVADFQLCFYNPLPLRRALEECGLALETSRTSRRIFSGKELIIEIEKNENCVKLVNHLRGYAYTLEGNFE